MLVGATVEDAGFEERTTVAGVRDLLDAPEHARLDEIVDGRKLRFSVEVLSADGRTVGVGTHERRIIALCRSPDFSLEKLRTAVTDESI